MSSNGYYDNGYQNNQYSGQQQQYYGAPGAPQPTYSGSNYNSYQPPRDDYSHETAVARYDEESGRNYNNDRYRSRSRGRYDEDRVNEQRRGSYGSNRSRSRSRRGSNSRGLDGEDGERGLFGGGDGDHHKGKDIGATLAGGALGGFVGHEFGHNKMATTIGALAGAFAGHELEKHHEKKKSARRDYESESTQYDSYSRRSLSGSRPGSRTSGSRSVREDYEYSDDEYEDRRPRHHHRRDSDRWD